MKIESIGFPRASHVNSGTSIPQEDLSWPRITGRVTRLGKVHVEVDQGSQVTPYGGLDLAVQLVRRFRVAAEIDARLGVLKHHKPYWESDHVLAQAFNLYVGGTCLEDQANLQQDEAVLRLVGACRLPDPTTAGDFLRRFDRTEHPEALGQLRGAIDEVQQQVWKRLRRGRRKRWMLVDLDSHLKELYGDKKEGADFHKSRWGYSPLLLSMAGTGECVAVRNRPGNHHGTANATAEMLRDELARLRGSWSRVLVRADSEFDQRRVREAVAGAGCCYAFVGREFANRPGIVARIPSRQWRPFRPRAERGPKPEKRRRKKRNRRHHRAKQRGWRTLRLQRQWVAEVGTEQSGLEPGCRLIVRRQRIEHSEGQRVLFECYRYRYIVTDLPSSVSAREVVDLTYQRCDQENVIEQMGTGLAVWRMPVAEYDANCAWLEIGRLAWNLAKWIAQLALPVEVVRWEWKRFRQAFVYVAAQVIRRQRQIWMRLSASHRFCQILVKAHVRLQT